MAADRKYPDPYIISAEDIAWFRTLRAVWVTVESGAPGIVPLETDAFFAEMEDANSRMFRRYEATVCAFFLGARFTPDTYSLAHPVDGVDRVVVEAMHLRLLRFANWRNGVIDGKRPYGSYTDYPIEMAEIVGRPIVRGVDGIDRISDRDRAELETLHRSLTVVVQAYIEHAALAPGPHVVPAGGFEPYIRPRFLPVGAAQSARYRDHLAQSASPPRDAYRRWQAEVEATNLLYDDLAWDRHEP